MKLAGLIEAVAESTEEPLASVKVRARKFREAGMISTGGRGPGGAEMTMRDVCTLLIGVAVPGIHDAAPAMLRTLLSARLSGLAEGDGPDLREFDGRSIPLHELLPWPACELPADHSALDLAACLIRFHASPQSRADDPCIQWIELETSASAAHLNFRFDVSSLSYRATYRAPHDGTRIARTATIGERSISEVVGREVMA